MISRETLWAETFMQQRLQEAEHERLIREARPRIDHHQPGYWHHLVQRMVQWVTKIRAHSDEAPKFITSQRATRPR